MEVLKFKINYVKKINELLLNLSEKSIKDRMELSLILFKEINRDFPKILNELSTENKFIDSLMNYQKITLELLKYNKEINSKLSREIIHEVNYTNEMYLNAMFKVVDNKMEKLEKLINKVSDLKNKLCIDIDNELDNEITNRPRRNIARINYAGMA